MISVWNWARPSPTDIESVFLPLSLSLEENQKLYLNKGAEAFRPGVDQLPGTCMEYYMSDDGMAFVGEDKDCPHRHPRHPAGVHGGNAPSSHPAV